ncbi:TetR/AcrR family transcriptional regulator [Actinoplanes sp. LDG1-06]|uniref:TetR/AcrR family transcriptional regulator n=1 Tax=Paractinoplanes ovalisporus TaxID=2810368 RepID=A0ABS2A7J1_9ACTN|nr:TetR/AcrR family transcriptional regulator [Actinoplanes ovalisporus]MBM2615796.1 TetR/AcrR family transcriptional regulator [Actinoplanes ovalisporus]
MAGRKRDPRAQAAALAAAEELLTEVGYHSVTMEKIAERSGVAKMTLYRWWPNKAAIVTDAVRAKLAPTAVPDTGSLADDLHTQLEALLGTLTRYGDASVVAGAMSSRGEAGRADLRDILHPWLEGLVTILERHRSADFPAELTAQSWVGYVLYRVVFLQEEVSAHDLRTLVAPAL